MMLRSILVSALLAVAMPGTSASTASSSLLAALLENGKHEASPEDAHDKAAALLMSFLAKVKDDKAAVLSASQKHEGTSTMHMKLADTFEKLSSILHELDAVAKTKAGNADDTALLQAPSGVCTCIPTIPCNEKNARSGTRNVWESVDGAYKQVAQAWSCPESTDPSNGRGNPICSSNNGYCEGWEVNNNCDC